MSRLRQPVLPLLPASAVAIGPNAGLVETDEGGVVYVCGLVTFHFAAGDEVGRRLAAVTLLTTNIATAVEVAAGFSIAKATLWRWRAAYLADGVAGLVAAKTGPKAPRKLTAGLAARIVALRGQGLSLAAVAAASGVSTDTVRRALRAAEPAAGGAEEPVPAAEEAEAASPPAGERAAVDDDEQPGQGAALPVLADPTPRTEERRLARTGLLPEAPALFTSGARLPLAGLWLALATPATGHLLEAFATTYGRLRNGFYGLTSIVLTTLFLALLRDPRAEGLTRRRPADLGRLLGLDRAPEVKTLRRRLAQLGARRRAEKLGAALARAHAGARPDVLGWLHIDGHTRAYTGTRRLPKTRIARLHVAGRASGETWVADANADPLLVIPALPTDSLAAELLRCLPQLRGLVGEGRRASVIFDRGGWSPATFAALIDAGFDVLTYRKAPYPALAEDCFSEVTYTDEHGETRTYTVAETGEAFDVGKGRTLWLRQVMRRTDDGSQLAILTSSQAPAGECCHRLGGRWRIVMWTHGCLISAGVSSGRTGGGGDCLIEPARATRPLTWPGPAGMGRRIRSRRSLVTAVVAGH